jgi:hypothetical protein
VEGVLSEAAKGAGLALGLALLAYAVVYRMRHH